MSRRALGAPLQVSVAWGYTEGGKLGEVKTHDLVGGLMPVHLKGHPLQLKVNRQKKEGNP